MSETLVRRENDVGGVASVYIVEVSRAAPSLDNYSLAVSHGHVQRRPHPGSTAN